VHEASFSRHEASGKEASWETEPTLKPCIVSASNLCAGYGKIRVLTNLSLEIAEGSLTGLCGPNGAGKSSFLKLCLGMLRPLSGEIRVLGELPGAGKFRKTLFHIGYVPQNTSEGSLPATVKEAVLMGRYGMTGFMRPLNRRDRERAYSAMVAVGVVDLADRGVRELSGGQAQRVAIARSLAMEAELLLLDEPTASLDAKSQEALLQTVQSLCGKPYGERGRPVTAVIVSHDRETLSVCDCIYRFENGTASKLHLSREYEASLRKPKEAGHA
jgi:ABC-type Mn2+/Zn2+ transport system ATPase subunit